MKRTRAGIITVVLDGVDDGVSLLGLVLALRCES